MSPPRIIILTLLLSLSSAPGLFADQQEKQTKDKAVLALAVMCESIKEYEPENPAIVFPISLGRVYCFSSFDAIPDRTYIYHKWYQRDRLVSGKRLTLKPPKWSTFSSMQLRMEDRGPWRVEITDNNGNILSILRFSISD